MIDESDEIEKTILQQENSERERIIAEKSKGEEISRTKLATDKNLRKIEDDKQARIKAENSFREQLENDFLQANTFATSIDFERLYQTLRDAEMIENLNKYRKNVNK